MATSEACFAAIKVLWKDSGGFGDTQLFMFGQDFTLWQRSLTEMLSDTFQGQKQGNSDYALMGQSCPQGLNCSYCGRCCGYWWQKLLELLLHFS